MATLERPDPVLVALEPTSVNPHPTCPPRGAASSADSPWRAGPGRLRPPPLALRPPAHRWRLPGRPAAAARLRAGSSAGGALGAGALPVQKPAGQVGRLAGSALQLHPDRRAGRPAS